MSVPINDVVTRMLLMRRRGLDRSEALRYSVVLSAADTTPALTALDAVLTDLVARRRAEQTVIPTPVVEVGAADREAGLVRAIREAYETVDRMIHSRGTTSKQIVTMQLLQLLLLLLQFLRDPAGQQFVRRMATSRDDAFDGLQNLLAELIGRLVAMSDTDDDQAEIVEARGAEASTAAQVLPRASFEVRGMRPDNAGTAVVVQLEDTSAPGDAQQRTWEFGDGKAADKAYSPRPMVTYGQPGLKTIRLIITDESGNRDEAEQAIFVPPPDQLGQPL